jgi:VanZ family protein
VLPLRHRGLWLASSAALVLVVIWGSLQTSVDLPVPGGFDKVEHFGTYAFLALWFTGMYSRSQYWLIALALLGLGLSMEICQYWMAAGREGDPFDMAANTLGLACGMFAAWRATGGWTPRVEAWLGRN